MVEEQLQAAVQLDEIATASLRLPALSRLTDGHRRPKGLSN